MHNVLLWTAAILAVWACCAQAQEECVRKSRRPGVKSVLEQSVDYVFGTNDAEVSAEANSCECVPHSQCDVRNGTRIEEGRGKIDIRISETPCEDQLEVCCDGEQRLTALPSLPPTTWPKCGVRNRDGVGFRITGNVAKETQFGEFPWMAALVELIGKQEKFVAGGSLIHPSVVLTAAHSVVRFKSDLSALRVRLGEWDTQSEAELFPHQTLAVREVIVHEAYYAGALHNDVALLVLHEAALAAENVGTICLPAQGALADSQGCLATGWGKDEFGTAGCYQVILKSIELPIVQRDKCQQLLRRTRLGPKFRLHRSFICAGGEDNQDMCKGDGGGPLVCPSLPGTGPEGRGYEQVGVVSWGVGCGAQDVPAAYADVARFRQWIDDRFEQLAFDTGSYRRD